MHNDLNQLLDIDILGDPHLGRIFKTGVPLHRLGDRDKYQFETFKQSLNLVTKPLHVCLGDLFDKFRVSNEIVLATAEAYIQAALNNKQTTYIVLQGNHDSSKDNEKVSSFQIFKRMVSYVPNIRVLDSKPEVFHNKLFVPWVPFLSAEEITNTVSQPEKRFDAVFAHWDIDNYGNEEAKYTLPEGPLSKLTNLVVLGHYHKPSETLRGSLRVITWGSMQPFAHGECPTGELYTTETKEAVELVLESNPDYYKHKCLRVLLDADQTPLAGIDCYALTHKRNDLEGIDRLDVEVDNFSLESVFKKTFEDLGVSDEITLELFNKI